MELLDSADAGPVPAGTRLWQAMLVVPGGDIHAHMAAHGRPITYGRGAESWPLDAYQTVFSRHSGSAEMASAGRPFTTDVVADLVIRGIGIAPVTLRAGVSSLEAHEPPGLEWYDVPAATAAHVRDTRRHGGRIVAVGTTVTRALESVAAVDGAVHGGAGWTDLVLAPDRPARVVDGLLTGWHEADASHLLLLDAVRCRPGGSGLCGGSRGPYLWHEFGDLCLLLPDRRPLTEATGPPN